VSHGLKPLARLFMLPAAELGHHMKSLGFGLPPTPSEGPEAVAARFVRPGVAEVATPERVLAAVRSMCAIEIACEPRIKAIMREAYVLLMTTIHMGSKTKHRDPPCVCS